MDSVEFKQLFYEVLEGFVSKPKKIDRLYADVLKRYSSRGRYYHNIDHIYSMCDFWLKHKENIVNPSFLFLAIVYHDIVYKSHKKDNEEQSAEYFHNIAFSFDFNMKPNEIIYVKDLIRYTEHNCFFAEKLHKDAQLLLDFDLCILSKNEDVYNKYSRDIRQEYKRYSNFLYQKGRLEVLQKFLDKDKIYLTKEFNLFEENARKNIKNEIIYLNSPKKRRKYEK
jgi:predicted metal-dependent HD superfamily phosphohydrolase